MEFRLLRAEEIDCRIGMCKDNGLTLLLYKDARVDMNVLDETVGPMNWQKSYSRNNANCVVSIWDEDKKQWVSKEDTGTESNTESEKGLASDSFKRACFNWGIGRELYSAPFIWISSDKCNIRDKKCYDTFTVTHIAYKGREISELEIVNNKTNKVCYRMGITGTAGTNIQPQPTPAAQYAATPAAERSNVVNIATPTQNTQSTNQNFIGASQINELQKMMADWHINRVKLLSLYKKSRIEELTQREYSNALNHWDKVIERCS